MLNVTLRQLEALAVVARHPTLKQAAAELRVTDSALGASITQLERTLGHRLIVRRRSHGVSVTSAGQLVSKYATEVMSLIEQLGEEFSASSEPVSGRVVMGVAPSLSRTFIPELLSRLGEAHPALVVDFETGSRGFLEDRLADGTLDLSIVMETGTSTRTDATPLADLPILVGVGPSHRLARLPEPIPLAELRDETMVALDTVWGREFARFGLASGGISPARVRRAPDLNFLMAIVAAGQGYGLFLGKSSQQPLLDALDIRLVTTDPSPVGMTALLLERPGERPTRRTAAVREACVELAAEMFPRIQPTAM